MKHAQRKNFKLTPIAAAVAVVLTAQFAPHVAQAGSGFGSGVTVTNTPNVVPTYYANSPSGPVPTLVNGAPTIRQDQSGLPIMGTTGTAIRKFVDTLPGFGSAKANDLGQYIPVAVAKKWVDLNGTTTGDDYYEIAAVEFSEKMHADLPKATHLRGYVQVESVADAPLAAGSKHIALTYPNGSPILDAARITAANPTGQVYAYDNPHHLGPVLNATQGVAVRVKFSNYLPVGTGFFLPVDTTLPGTGVGPDGKTPYTQNRAEMHLMGGQAPWVSAGTPHQWVAPAGETAAYTAGIGKGASAQNVPDMADPGPGSMTLYFPNNMSGRLTFFRDETSGLARLNTYAGMEAAYVISDPIEQLLVNGGTIPAGGNVPAAVTVTAGTLPADVLPLIFEDKTFVPQNIAQQDSLWSTATWGQPGDLWFPHVYEPNQDPTQASGVNPVGRWDYGPLFWPIFQVSADKATLPTPSFVPEAYMDTVLVNGTAYPTVTVDPKAYRVRLANASNDRFLNLGFYLADGTVQAPVLDVNGNPTVDATGAQQVMLNTEVKLIPASAIDAAGDPPGWDAANGVQLPLPQFGSTFPWHINYAMSGPTRAWPVDARIGGVPDPTTSGPDFIQIGTDGGFLPGGVDIPSQPITYEQNRRSVTVTNVYGYGMLIGPGERADTVVDFTPFAGKTLILYNDAPTPFPFLDQRDDYFTGSPDQTAAGGMYTTQPGYGPNTRTLLQVKVTNNVPVPGTGNGGPLNAAALAAALPAAYAATQPLPLVTQTFYNTAFGTNNPDTLARVATGSAAQPNLIFTTGTTGANPVTITGFSIITSGGAGNGSGAGYLAPPLVTLSGGGGGSGATATAELGAGVGAAPTANCNPQVPVGQVCAVVLGSPGSGYTSAPTVTFQPASTIGGVSIVDPGAGYTAADQVVFSGGGGSGAAASLTVSTSSALAATPVAWTGGAGYTVPPTVSFTPAAGSATPSLAATATTTITTSTLVLGTGGVNVTNMGSGYTAPTATVSAPQMTGTTATATPIAGFAAGNITIAATGLAPTNGGTAFDVTTDPNTGNNVSSATVSFSGPQYGTNQASGTVAVDTTTGSATFGLVTAINIVNPGAGYTSAPTATINDAKGNQATVTMTLAAGTGQIYGVNITAAGTGYTAPATVTIKDTTGTGTGATATAAVVGPNSTVSYVPVGVVNSFTITGTGRGYSAVPSVVFTEPAGNAAAATAATATVALNTVIGAITGVTMTNFGSGYTSAPSVSVKSVAGTGANLGAGLITAGVGAQATALTSNSFSYPVLTKAEQELFDDYGRYNSTGGVELPYTTANVQTTIPLNYYDAPTEVIGDGEVQVWKIVDNGFWSNSMHFNIGDIQLLGRVGWDGTVKQPATNEAGWKDTVRLNPLEDMIVAVQGKRSQAPFGQPRSTRLQDPSTPSGTPSHPAAPAPGVVGTTYVAGLGFTADPGVVQQAGLFAAGTDAAGNAVAAPAGGSIVPVNTQLLTTAVNTSVLPASPTGNYDNEFLWGTAIMGHGQDDLQRPVVFNPVVKVPGVPTNLADPLGTGTLTWTDPTPAAAATTPGNPQNEIGFQVLQAPVTNGQPSGAFTPVGNPFAYVPANTVNYAEPAALVSPTPPNGQFYASEVVAYNAAGASTTSNIVVEAPPAAPTSGAAQGLPVLTPGYIVPAVNNTSDVNMLVQWQDNAINETNYIVTRKGGSGATTVVTNGAVTAVNGGTTASFTLPPNTKPISTDTIFNDAGPLLEGAWYEYDIVAKNSFGSSAALVATVQAPISVPLAPANALATSTVAAPCPIDAVTKVAVPTQCKPNNVVLTWVDQAFNETNYWIDRSGGPTGTTFTRVVLPGSLNNAGATMSWTDTTVQEGYTYTYTISAVNTSTSGAQQIASASASATIAATAPTIPSHVLVAPSTAVGATGTYVDTATITWSDNAYNEDSYQVYRDGLAVGAPITSAAGTLGAGNNPMGTATSGWASSPVLSYTDSGLGDGSAHTWYVQALNGVGTTNSATVGATMPGIVINPPTGFTATPNFAGSSIRLCWTNTATNETDFLVEESLSTTAGAPGSFGNWTIPTGSPLASTAAANTQVCFARANVPTTPGYVYSFRLSARNLANKSDSHPYVYTQASLLSPAVPAAPVLNVPTVAANNRVRLTWSAVAPAAGTTVSYLVFANGVQIAAVGFGTAYSYIPTLAALQAGITYTVETVATAIRGPNPTAYGSSTSLPSAGQKVGGAAPAAPAVPAGLAATINAATGAVTLNWTADTAVAGTTISYLVSVNGAPGVAMARGATLAVATGASYSVTVAGVATQFGLSTTSAYSAPITVDLTAAGVPSAPATLAVTATRLNWTAPATVSANSTVTYNVQQSVNGGATWTTLTATPIAALTLAVASPVGTNYQYRVQAFATRYGLATSAGSAWTTTTFNTAPAQSTGLTVAGVTATHTATVTFTNTSTNITGFTITRATVAANGTVGAFAAITPAPTVNHTAGTTTYSFTNVAPAAGRYQYRVVANSAGGSTAALTTATVTL